MRQTFGFLFGQNSLLTDMGFQKPVALLVGFFV